jgi:hypothetical protein
MTTKKSTTKRGRSRAKTPAPTSKETSYALSYEQAQGVARSLLYKALDEDESMAAFMLLLRSLTYTDAVTDREDILQAVQNVFLPHTDAAQKTLHQLLERAYQGTGGLQK